MTPHLTDHDIDRLTDQAIAQLQQWLAHHGSQQLALLIDPVAADPFAEQLHEQALPTVRCPFPGNDLADAQYPYLVWFEHAERQIRLINDSLRLAIHERCGRIDGEYGARSLCAWIIPGTGEPALAELAQQIGRTVPAFNPAGERMLFRYYDPRITPLLPTCLSGPNWRAMISLQHYPWLTMDEACTLQAISPDPQGAAPLPHLQLSEAEMDALAVVGLANHLGRLVPQWGLAAVPDGPQLRTLAQQAFGLGLQHPVDQLTYAYHALHCHPRFTRHPLIQPLLQQDSFAQALATLTETEWQRIAQDCAAEPNPR
ncbi:hypothetical protein HNQ59_001546 [Chitinivorax tropicus]|uniref:DUF4123 domain-containing protein n=1 Tax=Chitinivorax tropicus TaxID=714531 RepID=A0A840MHY3_9PROT|nr:hypothetical protein [Chitinivorax tropicus]MBB5018258.1 hypothetical protein [Chitinivorax tropicus]